jgi:N-acetylmuramoyl-L-alanine amidase
MANFYGLSRPVNISPKQLSLVKGDKSLVINVGERHAVINGVRHWLNFPVLEQNGAVLISRSDLVKTIEPLIRPTRIPGIARFDTVVLDPGHGGHDEGARSRYSPNEKVLTLDVARRVRPLLQRSGFNVVMTRNRDVFVPLEERANIAAALPNSVLVSIHFNSGQSDATGIETFCLAPKGTLSASAERLTLSDYQEFPGNDFDAANILLAHSMQRRLNEILKSDAESRGVKRARFVVLKNTPRPAVLLEGGFISNASDARLAAQEERRQAMAERIHQAIVDFQALLNRGEFEGEQRIASNAKQARLLQAPAVETAPPPNLFLPVVPLPVPTSLRDRLRSSEITPPSSSSTWHNHQPTNAPPPLPSAPFRP